jgi:hypothetical protein
MLHMAERSDAEKIILVRINDLQLPVPQGYTEADVREILRSVFLHLLDSASITVHEVVADLDEDPPMSWATGASFGGIKWVTALRS